MENSHGWVSITCPECSAAQNVFTCKIADVSEEPELRQKLFKGELNIFDCVQCGAKLHYDEYLLYTDREKGLVIHVFSQDYGPKINDICDRLVKEFRLVPADELFSNFILFGYANLAKIVALIERPENIKNMRAQYAGEGDRDLYRRLFILSQEWLNAGREKIGQQRADELFNEAYAFHRNKEYDAAVSRYREALAEKPNHYSSLFNLGLVYFNTLEDNTLSLECFRACREIRPNDNDLVFCLGQIHLKLENIDDALGCFLNSVVLQPHSSLAWFNAGLCLGLKGRTNETFDCLRISLDLAATDEDRTLIEKTIERFRTNRQPEIAE